MLFEITAFIATAIIAVVHGAPLKSHTDSYASNNLGLGAYRSSSGSDLSKYGIRYVTPTITKHEIIKKVPIIAQYEEHQNEEQGPAVYAFSYGVDDKHTNDMKRHKETRHGDVVEGEYSFKEADGTIRTVKYTVDKKSGFNAVVTRTGHAVHPQVEQKHKVLVKQVVVPTLKHDQVYYHN